MKPALLICSVLGACQPVGFVDPLKGYYIMSSHWDQQMIPICAIHNEQRNFPLTNWLSVTSASAPQIVTSVLKATPEAAPAKGQIWVSASASYVNTPEITDWPGETNGWFSMPAHKTTNNWPLLAQSISLVYVRSIDKATGGRIAGQDYYARCSVRVWNHSGLVQSDTTLLLSDLTNRHALVIKP